MRLSTFGIVVAASTLTSTFTRATVIETFDTPNTLSVNGNFAFTRDGGSFTTGGGGTVTRNATNFQISFTPPAGATSGYGTGYHSIYSNNKPPAGSGLNNGVIDISSNNMLQLDVTINSGTAGLFIDLQDGAGNLNRYLFGYGLATGGVAGNGPPQRPGETIQQGAGANELILSVPLSSPVSTIPGDAEPPVPFDFSQIVLFRIENDPGPVAAYDIAFNDLSAVTTPEPAALAVCAFGGLFLGRRRRA